MSPFQKLALKRVHPPKARALSTDAGISDLRRISSNVRRTIEYVDVKLLRPNDRNARRHSPQQIDKIAASIMRFGFIMPVLIDANGSLIAGHARLFAGIKAGLTEVPCVRITHLSDSLLRAYMIADNRLAQDADWNQQILREEFLVLQSEGIELLSTGFEIPEIALIIDGDGQEVQAADDVVPDALPERVVTKVGDLWTLGVHRLICANARERESYSKLLSEEKARLIFTDPPYNVPIDGNVGGKGRVKHREFVQASGELTSPQFERFLEESLSLMAERSVDGSIHYVCIDWRHVAEVLTAGRRVYRELKNFVVWNKTNAGMGSFYRSQHEIILVWKNGRGKHINNFSLGQYGRSRTNVWTYAGINTFGDDRKDELAMHPTVKPVAMIADAIKDCSGAGDLVLDPFGGSGSTLIACERTGRKARLIELDPIYCDIIIRRWQAVSGQQAVHGVTGEPFDNFKRDKR